ncbi:MAG TPA: 3-oxoacyl-ACP reductase FabG [Mycobacteriales bacterium]|nr:3-oxoacyl-ACP reductase FabG [Mycobacteriales bacterium]
MTAVTSRSVLVTGGNQGIGLGIAQRLAAAGHRVAVTHHASSAPADLHCVKCDVTDRDSVAEAVAAVSEAQGAVEVLVYAAGITRDGLALRMADRDWDDVIETDLAGAWACARSVLPAMAKARHGRLLFVGSVVGLLGSAGQANYAAAKAGLIGLARSLAREYAGRGITSNVLAPGLVETAMTASLSDAQRADIVARTPLGRAASVAEIASVAAFLVGDEASYLTGAVVPVDGGLGMGH